MTSSPGPSLPRRLQFGAIGGAACLAGLVGMTIAAPVALRAGAGLRLALVGGEIALMAPSLLVAALGALPLRAVLGLRGIGRRATLGAVACGVAFWVTSAGIVETQSTVWPPPPSVFAFFHSMQADLGSGLGNTLATVAALAIAPAVAEELAFRGALLGGLEVAVGSPLAVLLSAALFGAIHWTPGGYRVPFAFVLGAALAVVRVRTGSVGPGMIAHAILNTITLTLTPGLDDPSELTAAPLLPALLLLAGGAVISALLVRRLPPLTAEQSTH